MESDSIRRGLLSGCIEGWRAVARGRKHLKGAEGIFPLFPEDLGPSPGMPVGVSCHLLQNSFQYFWDPRHLPCEAVVNGY